MSNDAEHTAQEGVGEPDPFQRLWTPHRLAYIRGGKGDGCPFCTIPSLSDEDALIVARGSSAYVVLNLYPYNPGHLMVVPFRHVAEYEELEPAEVYEIGLLTQKALRVCRAVANPHGFNVGLNLGVVAGAGIAAHLHQHIVPRWGGDTNFMPVVGQTKVLPEILPETRALYAAEWSASG